MILEAFALLATLAGPGPVPKGDQAPARYRVDVKTTQTVDLSAAGQGVQTMGVTATIFVNVATRDTSDGMIAHVVIDSMTVAAEGQLQMAYPAALADSIKGEYLDAHIVDGRSSGAPTLSSEGNPMLALTAQSLGALFPGIGPKAAGQTTWSDTTNSTTIDGTNSVTSNQIINWTVNGTSGNVLELTGTSTGTVNGEQNGNQISGTVGGTITTRTPIGGPAQHSEIKINQDIQVLSDQMPEPVSVKVNVELTADALP